MNSRASTRPIRVLMIAEACNPEWTSVPLVGYNWYKALASIADVTLVTQIRNREAMLRRASTPNRVEFIDSERVARPLHAMARCFGLAKGLGWTTSVALKWPAYLYFEYLAYQRFRHALDRGEYDIVHRITPLTPTFPSPIASWSSTPFVLGPLNGGLPWPPETTRVRLAELEWLSYVRGAYQLLPFSRSTYRRAARVIAGSMYTLSALPHDVRRYAVYIPENGIDPSVFNAKDRLPVSQVEPFRILFVGRLVPYKGADMVLQAVGSSPRLRRAAEVVLVGAGPEERRLRQMASSLGIADHTRFMGSLPQQQVAAICRRSSVMAFPSLREFGGAVVIEAMACGLPCIVINHGGPAEHVTDQTGVRLPLGTRQAMIAAMQAALEDLCARRDRLAAMSVAGIERVQSQYIWARKAEQMQRIYWEVVGNG